MQDDETGRLLLDGGRRDFLKGAAVGAAALAFPGLANGRNLDRPPNIVIIFTDDQGYGDVGCYGATDFETPNLDRMAAEGMKFTSFYVSQAVCSASRASLLTGCYNGRVGIQGALSPRSKIGLHPEERTIASMLRRRGYATAIYGKWHLGHHREFLPVHRGFEEYMGLPYSNDMWPFHYDGTPVDGAKSQYPPLPLIEGDRQVGEIDSLDNMSELTRWYTERAVSFIRQSIPLRKYPFFLYVPHTMPHTPLAVSDRFRGKSRKGLYGDVMMELDWSVGQILEAVKDCGIDEDTLVIFTSDNGPWLRFREQGGSAGPLREGKGTMWEGGVRVPCIMRWPGHIAPGVVCDSMAATIDILPTIAAITGAALPEKKIDGVSILPLLEGRKGIEPRTEYFMYYGQELHAVRKGKWKLHFPHSYPTVVGLKAGTEKEPGQYAMARCGLELYDLENDIGETTDVAASHPDIVADLQALAERAREDLGDSLTGRAGKGVREPGRIATPKRRVYNSVAGSAIALGTAYSPRYPGSGKGTLVDGEIGGPDFTDPAWQGYEGEDLEATIRMRDASHIIRISCRFLEDQASWIFLPDSVEFSVSMDNARYRSLKAPECREVESTGSAHVYEYFTEYDRIDPPDESLGLYIRVRARNIKTCPAGHIGAGEKAWLFTDEIVVRHLPAR